MFVREMYKVLVALLLYLCSVLAQAFTDKDNANDKVKIEKDSEVSIVLLNLLKIDYNFIGGFTHLEIG